MAGYVWRCGFCGKDQPEPPHPLRSDATHALAAHHAACASALAIMAEVDAILGGGTAKQEA